MRLVFIVTPRSRQLAPSSAYPMDALRRRDHDVVWPVPLDDDVPMRELYGCDLVHGFRREDRNTDLQALSLRGVAIKRRQQRRPRRELGVCEGIASLAARRGYAKRAALLAAQSRHADLVTTPSRVIAAKYEATGVRNVAVIENYAKRPGPDVRRVP